jgi:hypothetical protein
VDFTTSLRDLFAPVATSCHSYIVLPSTNVTHFDLKPHVIQLLPSFHGLDLENPYSHVKKFIDMCTTFKFQNFSEKSIHLRLFPFSLHGKARAWLDSNTSRSITSWESLLSKFYNNFFPISKVNECRKEISSFTQEEDEKFSESWERFKESLIRCPPHKYEKWRLVQFVYQGDENQQASLKDPLYVPIGPITRARSKMIKEAFSGLIQEIWAGSKMGHSKFGPKEDEGVINLIQAIDGADLA